MSIVKKENNILPNFCILYFFFAERYMLADSYSSTDFRANKTRTKSYNVCKQSVYL